jgi:hypothetical protein
MSEMAKNKIANFKTVEVSSDTGGLTYAVMIGIDLPDLTSSASFIEQVATLFKNQRMISPPSTSLLLITLIGKLPGARFVEQWHALSTQDPILRVFMTKMTKADLICASPDGAYQQTFSLLLPSA